MKIIHSFIYLTESPYILISTSYQGSTIASMLCLDDASILTRKANFKNTNTIINDYNFRLMSKNFSSQSAAATAAAAKSLQSCLTLCNPIEGSPPGSSVPGILQARTLEWVAISFSNAWKWKVKGKSLSHVWLLATSWTAAYQASPSMGFSRQEYWRGVPLPSPQLNDRNQNNRKF